MVPLQQDSSPSRLGLVRLPGHRDRFALTDNLTGWFEGFTHGPTLGGGYMVRDEFVFEGWASEVNGRPVDREFKALSDTVFPWGQRIDYPGLCEELLLHSGRRILSLRVTTELAATIHIVPFWLDPFPKSLKRGTVVRRTANSLTLHLIFGETDAEFRANQDVARKADLWEAEVARRVATLTDTWIRTGDNAFDLALFWAQASARSFVTTEFGTGLWAGLPWFKDNWGRDTFISLPGTLLVTGQFAQARAVLENFARYQNLDPADPNYGRIPNRVNRSEVLYNTVDGTPWMIREVLEYARVSGDLAFALAQRPMIRRYVDGALRYFVDDEGLLCHDDADTWMDARIAGATPWSPRGNRAVEIQVLWITALDVGAELARHDHDTEESFFQGAAERARTAFVRLFVHGEGSSASLWDRIDATGIPDPRLRPNALMAVSIPLRPLLTAEVRDALVRSSVEALLLPYGVLSLGSDDADFHPRHENPVYWHKDAAYHNGTVWGWNAGFVVAALSACGWPNLAWKLTQNLADQILQLGTLGTMSELLDAQPDANGRLVPTGTFSQAWSVAEFVRSAWQDTLGLKPDLLRGVLEVVPHLPSAWTKVSARTRFGERCLDLTVVQEPLEGRQGALKQVWTLTGAPDFPPVELDGRIYPWTSAILTLERVVEVAQNEPEFATLAEGAVYAVLAAGDVLLRHRSS